MKFRFGLDQFSQRTVRGAFWFLLLGLLSFVLAFWTVLDADPGLVALGWGAAARGCWDALVLEVVAARGWVLLRRVKLILEAQGIMNHVLDGIRMKLQVLS
jgi:hypothetical protein